MPNGYGGVAPRLDIWPEHECSYGRTTHGTLRATHEPPTGTSNRDYTGSDPFRGSQGIRHRECASSNADVERLISMLAKHWCLGRQL